MRNEECGRRPKTFEDRKLQVLLDEDDTILTLSTTNDQF